MVDEKLLSVDEASEAALDVINNRHIINMILTYILALHKIARMLWVTISSSWFPKIL